MTLRKQIAALLPLVFAAGAAGAQGLKSGPYELPYKNTYVKEVFVAENEFRTAKPETIKPRSFAEARKILPAPVWEGHDKEIELSSAFKRKKLYHFFLKYLAPLCILVILISSIANVFGWISM